MKTRYAVLAAAMALGTAASASQAAMLFLSTSATDPGAVSPTSAATNPSLSIPQGSQATLYIWAQLNDLEGINGLGIDLKQSDGNVTSAAADTVENPSAGSGRTLYQRWAGVNNGSLGAAGSTTLVSGINAAFVSGQYWGLDGYSGVPGTGGDSSHGINGVYVAQAANADGSGEATVGSLLVGSVTLNANNVGTTNLFLGSGQGTISYDFGGPMIHFGGGDAAVDPRTAGVFSAAPDATITVTAVPEPASLSLLGLGALGLIARRRRA